MQLAQSEDTGCYDMVEIKGPFRLEDASTGKRLVLTAEWQKELIGSSILRKVTEVEINYARGWVGPSVDFLKGLAQIKKLVIVAWKVSHLRAVESLAELESLQINVDTAETINFGSFPKLKELRCEWNAGFHSALSVGSIETLSINRLPKKYIHYIGRLSSLRDLSLLTCSSTSLDAIRDLERLESLRLALFGKLESNEFISGLHHLKTFWGQSCRGFGEFEPYQRLQFLESIILESCGPFKSLEPLCSVRSLRELVVVGRNSRLKHGVPDCLTRLPKLERLIVN